MDPLRYSLALLSTPFLAGLPWSAESVDPDGSNEVDEAHLIGEQQPSSAAAWDGPFGTGALTIETGAFVGSTDQGEREFGGWVGVALPLERLWAPRAPVRRAIAEGASPSVRQPREQSASGDRAPPSSWPRVPPALARACVAAAWRASGLGSMSDLDDLSGRARTSGLLPEARFRVSRTWDRGQKLTPTDSDPYRLQDSTSATQWLEGRLTWRLDRLVFADEEVAIEKMRAQRIQQRMQVAGKVLAVLFDWYRASATARDASLPEQERMEAWLRASEAEATLDVLTGGWFSTWTAGQAE